MSSQLGWVQINRARDAGRAGARRGAWGDDERRVRPLDRDRGMVAGRPRRRVLRLGWVLTVVAVVVAKFVSRGDHV